MSLAANSSSHETFRALPVNSFTSPTGKIFDNYQFLTLASELNNYRLARKAFPS